MQFKDYKLIFSIIVCFISLSCFAQPGLQGDLYLNINTKKYAINAYSISKNGSLENFNELVKLKTQIHTQQKNLAVLNFVDERKNLFSKNILIVVSRNNKKMMIIITGELNPYENYMIDINKVYCGIFSIKIKKGNTLPYENRMGSKNLTPLLKKIE